MAGAVLRASGSTTTFCFGSFGSAFFTSAACFAPHTTEVRAGVLSPAMRFIVSAMRGSLRGQREELLGARAAREGPEPGAAAAGHDDREDVVTHEAFLYPSARREGAGKGFTPLPDPLPLGGEETGWRRT